MQQTDVLIVGAGLAGLALADRLARGGRSFQLWEARSRTGGRILTQVGTGAAFDMGPAWYWPGQPRIAALVDRFGLRPFAQHATGALTFEDAAGDVQRGRGFASMDGSFRVAGGLSALTDALTGVLPEGAVTLGRALSGLTRDAGRGRIVAQAQDGARLEAVHVVLALPPRLVAGLTFAPALSDGETRAMAQIPTWMAGQAKAVAVYGTPFWRDAGLSGDAMSRRGPLAEIHDASPASGLKGALFGFVGVPPAARRDEDALRAAILAQLERLFGPEAAHPQALHIKDWAQDPFTATQADQQPLFAHPRYGLPPVLDGLWDGRLILAGTEVAQGFGGFLEGALEAAEAAQRRLEHP